MNAVDFVWIGRDADDFSKSRVRRAQSQSDLSAARVRGMKIRAEMSPPRAAAGTFPYPARTCAQWTRFDDHEGRKP